ncbi:Ig-like domain (group 3) [Amycolatopsis tolypomycina]|uniref:Ig-like domain (Group 3) n=1 Tax=Amycolatopsis tolypomycina TaxID=208445 RepID=A0A1H4NWF8_9PSEU|nr:Ig-like domain-containing protein [Amycolatopsis tolypomycina]SEB99499.1 Ig-like domain (group 3) [Amycolatopsis tolypomycina]
MVVDEILEDDWTKIQDTQQSTEGIAGPWDWKVTTGVGTHITATTSASVGAEFAVGQFKATASGTVTEGVTHDMTYTVERPFHAIIPQGQVMYANYGAHRHNILFHWHRSAKDCTDLESGQYKLTVPFAQGFYWRCETRLDPDCRRKIEAANSGTPNAARLAESFYPYYALLELGPPTEPPPPVRKATSVAYTGPTTAAYHDSVVASAKVTSEGRPVGAGLVTFTLGRGSCVAGVGPSGTASCSIDITDTPGAATMRVSYGGTADFFPSSTSAAFTITKAPTKLAYTGTKHIANGEPARLAAVLTENGRLTGPLAGRTVHLTMGQGATQQACDATTDAAGAAQCEIASPDQPLERHRDRAGRGEFRGRRVLPAVQRRGAGPAAVLHRAGRRARGRGEPAAPAAETGSGAGHRAGPPRPRRRGPARRAPRRSASWCSTPARCARRSRPA